MSRLKLAGTLAMLCCLSAASIAQQPASAPPAAAPAAAAPAPAPAAAPAAAPAGDVSEGKVAWYGRKFAGRKTASGQRFDPGALTMAHKTLPFGTRVKVTNPKNNKSVVVLVNDRGPTQPDRVGDLSQAAAARLGMLRSGVIDAKLEVLAAPAPRKAKKA